ncbi:MAG: hypothetical protein ABI835_06315 [Chloroflexota bacterium]
MINNPRARQLLDSVLNYIVRLPRAARIGLAALFALSVTLLVTPLAYSLLGVDLFVLDAAELTAPTAIALVCGLVFYFLGWRLMVGYAGETPKPSQALLWYFGTGAVMCLFTLILVINGAISGTAA